MQELQLVQDLAIVTFAAGIGGLICQKIGLSSIVGFLLAGISVGPYAHFAFPVNEDRVTALSQLGLVFLMFSIGLELSVAKLRRIGTGVGVTVAVGGCLVFNIIRLVCPLLGIHGSSSLFVAAMFVASSSATIGKILTETGLVHQRAGNLAMSITVFEDIVAVIVLTIISSIAQLHASAGADVERILGVLVVFVTLVVVFGLLLLPKSLQRLNRAGADLLTITLAGLVLGTAVMAVRCGTSLALGAFLVGAIVAETPQRPAVERAMQGMRDVFIAVFFVSIGMLLNPALLLKNWMLILSLGCVAIVVRIIALTTALLATGNSDRDAFRAALMVTPIGELAFISAQVGVSTHLLSPEYYGIAVGVALFTAFICPFLIRNSGQLSDEWVKFQPPLFHDLLGLYQQFLSSVGEHQRRSRVSALARQILPPLLVSVAFVAGILIFAPLLLVHWNDIFAGASGWWQFHLFWALIGVAAAAPTLGIWSRLAEFFKGAVEIAFGSQNSVLLFSLDLVAAIVLLVSFCLLTPFIGASPSFIVAILGTAIVYVLFLGHRLQTVQHRISAELADAILSMEERRKRTHQEWLQEHQEWDLTLGEIRVPDSDAWFGKSLGELALRSRFGCSVVGVERQGYPVPSPGPDTELFPGDQMLVLGTEEQIRRVRQFFESSPLRTESIDLLNEIRLESVEVPESCRLAGNTLGELEIPKHTGVQIVGIARGDHKMLFPGPFQILEPGDWLLVVGTRDQIVHFRSWSKESS
jgi:monovalent cation:H+ antiporter-2, CPA2 family